MQAILSADRNWGIGKDGGLLVRVSEDMKFFRKKTQGHAVVMGRKTFESLPGCCLAGAISSFLAAAYAPRVQRPQQGFWNCWNSLGQRRSRRLSSGAERFTASFCHILSECL